MSSFLFVVPPLAGHVNPTVAVAAELTGRGHDVAWAGNPERLPGLLPDGARLFPATDDSFDTRMRAQHARWLTLRGPAALKFFWQEFAIPLAHAMLPGVEAAITSFRPDVVVSDQQALAGAIAARRAGISWATSATTPIELLRPLAAMPKIDRWVADQMIALQDACGLTDLAADLRFSDQLVLTYVTPALIGDVSGFGDHFVFPGPALSARPERGSFPWDWLDPERRHLLISLGTLSGESGQRFFTTAVQALADLGGELQAVIVAPPALAVARAGPHILFAEHVPQIELLPHVSAVVNHGGSTVYEALAYGLPLVISPVRDDQPVIARLVTEAGAGVQVRFGRLQAAELGAAIHAVLDDPRYGIAARSIGESFAAAGGAVTAADHLEKLT
jgi:MGT family glycosyltransferase